MIIFYKGKRVPRWICDVQVYKGGKLGLFRFNGFGFAYKWKGRIIAVLLIGKSLTKLSESNSVYLDLKVNKLFHLFGG